MKSSGLVAELFSYTWVMNLDLDLEPALGHRSFIFDLDLSRILRFTRPASGEDRKKLTDYSLL